MSYKFICPYCFHEMTDEQVHFVSGKLTKNSDIPLPGRYTTLNEYLTQTNDSQEVKNKIIKNYNEWEFFRENQKDEAFNNYWGKRGGADNIVNKIIQPSLEEHQKFLEKQKDDYLIKDNDGMVSAIKIKNGPICRQRVCSKCHNKLEMNYGKHDIRFSTVIGITSAGKTVYLSQLLKQIREFGSDVGLSIIPMNDNARNFVNDNQVKKGLPLPPPTPLNVFQKPLIFSVSRTVKNIGKITQTLVLHDIAGELFSNQETLNGAKLSSDDPLYTYVEMISHSSGAILLIDPEQFEEIAKSTGKSVKADPDAALLAIIDLVFNNKNRKCNIPFAICLAKADSSSINKFFSKNLQTLTKSTQKEAREEIEDYTKETKINTNPIFDATTYNSLAEDVHKFIKRYKNSLAINLSENYSDYNFFALSATGFECEEKENGISYLKNDPISVRIEDPLYWLFYKFGYIDSNDYIYTPDAKACSECDKYAVVNLEKEVVEKSRLSCEQKGKTIYKKICLSCGKLLS